MKLNKITALAGLIGSLSLLGCDNSGQLPNGAEIRVSPASHRIVITQVTDDQGVCLYNPDNYVDTPLLLSMHDGQGSPIGDAELTVSMDYSGQTYLGPPMLSLYEDLNSNGVVDVDSELVAGAGSDGYIATTQEYSGEKQLFLRINLSCEYQANVHVFSLFNYGSMNVSVVAEEDEE